jgi:hypothetical protein
MEECKNKEWYHSRVLWINIIALIASILQWKYKMVLPGEIQGMILTIINILLRLDTSQAIGKETPTNDGER